MTDAEIIKGTECCSSKSVVCKDCPYCGQYNCVQELGKDTIDLINRQKAEIERLEAEIDKQYEQARADILGNMSDGGASCHWCISQHKAEAIKEFAERLKEELRLSTGNNGGFVPRMIDELVKEMAGEK